MSYAVNSQVAVARMARPHAARPGALTRLAALVGILAVLGGTPAFSAETETLPEGDKLVSLSAFPETIELGHEFAYRQLVLTGKLESGVTVDATRLARPDAAAKTVAISPSGLVTPVAAGSEEISFTLAGQSVKVKVAVTGIGQPFHPSFVRDVQPALSRMGCNQGTCHGANAGKAGFKLSLRGYDAQYDFEALTDELGARRFNRSAPDQSLFLLKATGSVPHVGGVRTTVDSSYYRLIEQWISDGVKLDLGSPRVVKIEVFPNDPILSLPGQMQQMAVLATFADGGVRDVTREAFIESGDIEILESQPGGLLKTLRRGEAPVLARYEGAYVATTITIMGDRSGFAWQEVTPYNYIDQHVYEKLKRVKVAPSPLCTDDEFLRRVTLDLTGLPPTADAVRAFLADTRETRVKREELVDRLIGSPDFVEHWTNKWADLLLVNRKFLGEEGALSLRNWIEQSVAENKPYNRFAYELLTAQGSTRENPAAAYYKIQREPEAAMENTTHLFLAVRFNCNKCHDHPFERWTQDQYYQLSAFFAQVGRKEHPAFAGQKIGGSAVEGAQPLVEVVFDSGGGEVKHLRTGAVTPPTFPYPVNLPQATGATRREQLARWMTSPENPYFARSYANRLWGYLFGRGLIEPIDDIRAGNPPTNPQLLDALTADFVASGFNYRHVLSAICKSRTYQHSLATNVWNADDTINYSHAIPRRLPAEVLYDAIHRAAGSAPRLPGVPAGFRAAQLPDAGVSDPFLDDFGRPPREAACECERTTGIVLGPVMKLINGPTVANALADGNSELSRFVASQPDDSQVVAEVFLRFLGRPPTATELQVGLSAIQEAGAEAAKGAAELAAYEQTLPEKQAAWEASARSIGPATWNTLEFAELKSNAGATFARQEGGSYLVQGTNAKDVYTLTATVQAQGITGLRLEALPHASLASQGPGRAQNGNFVLNEIRLAAGPAGDAAQAKPVPLQNAVADFSQQSWEVRGAIDGNEATGWAVSPDFGKPHTATFETANNLNFEGGALLRFELVQEFGDGLHQLGHFRIQYTTSPRPFTPPTLPAPVAAALAVAPAERSPEMAKTLADHFKSLDGRYQELAAQAQRATEQAKNQRLTGIQDLAWALINNPAFLFNR